MIKGIQGEGVGACVKHFACNNSDTRRTRLNCMVDPRALHEIYLAGFERAIKKPHRPLLWDHITKSTGNRPARAPGF